MEDTNTTNTTAHEGAHAAQNAAANQAAATATGAQNAAQEGAEDALDSRMEALIQRAVDRATNKLGNDNKKLRAENEKLKKEKLTEEELRQLELKERDEALNEREKALLDRENRMIAIKAIKDIGLDDGSSASLDLVDFVMGEDEEAIKGKVKVFDELVKRFVKAEVDRVFKNNGRTPGVGNAAAGEDEGKQNSVAVQLGKNATQANKAARSTRDYYLGRE